MLNWTEWKKKPLFNLLRLLCVFLITIAASYLFIKAAGLLAPFVLALLGALAMEPLLRLVTKKTKKGFGIPRSIASLAGILIFGGAIVLLLTLLVLQLIEQTVSLAREIPTMLPGIVNWLTSLLNALEHQIEIFPIDFPEDFFSRITNGLYSWIGELSRYSNTVVRGVWTTASMLPSVLLFFVVWIVGTYYFAAWQPRIVRFLKNSAPESWMRRATEVKSRLFHTFFGYLRAQLLLMIAVFIVILISFSIQRIEYALLFALIIAVFDMLPMIGSGLFLNTGAIIFLLTGDYFHGVGLFITWIAVVLLRNTLEPRLVGVQIGLPPLLTMAAMYVGLRLIGFLGLIAGPILIVLMMIVYEYYARGRTLKQVLLGEEPGEREDGGT